MKSAIVCTTTATLRQQPDDKSEMVDEALYGMEVQILEDLGDYAKVETFYRYQGYIRTEELVCDQTLVPKWQQGTLYVISKSFADVLSAPKVQGLCLQGITRGGCVLDLGPSEAEGWRKVGLIDGREGYTKESFLMPMPSEPCFSSEKTETGQNCESKDNPQGDSTYAGVQTEEVFRARLVETAKLYLGTQYRWGGRSPLGIDCSGLVSMAYLLNGVIIYRDAKLMEGFPLKEIAFEDKKPGDALYFPGHIAMYMGDGYYIHSTGKNGSDGVVINSLDPKDPLYREDLPGKILATGSYFA
ncbi:MAG: C40 family peptidase [Lachnospiraceae bacterium]|nr:C40 family peptidase [Lachnospiraceae bacterium]